MKLDVATNMDPLLLDYVKEIDKDHKVDSFFGKLKKDVVGGGRSSVSLPDVTLDQVFEYNARCIDAGIRFNYLLNPLCLNNRDVIARDHRKIVSFISDLYKGGIRWVTVCSPYLLEIIKNQFPEMKVTIGLYAFIGNLQQAYQWIKLGADELTMMQSYNRNFPALRELLTNLKEYDVNIRIIGNNACLHECPFSVSHGSATAASSADDDESREKYFDYNLINCYSRKINNPDNLIASDWIRPEDIKYYDKLCEETGNDRLVLKLVERTKPTEFLMRVIQAYINEKYEGNLVDLFNWIGNRGIETAGNTADEYVNLIRMGDVDTGSIIRYSSFFNIPHVQIDNQKLDGFIRHFVENYQCDKKICWMKNEDPTPEERKGLYCTYCHEWRKKVLNISKEEQEKWSKNTEILKYDFESSRFFKMGG